MVETVHEAVDLVANAPVLIATVHELVALVVNAPDQMIFQNQLANVHVQMVKAADLAETVHEAVALVANAPVQTMIAHDLIMIVHDQMVGTNHDHVMKSFVQVTTAVTSGNSY